MKLFEKVSKFLENINLIKEAIDIIEEAINIIEEDTSLGYSLADIFNSYIRLILISDRYDDAIAAYRKQIEKNKNNEKSYVHQVILSSSLQI